MKYKNLPKYDIILTFLLFVKKFFQDTNYFIHDRVNSVAR